MTLKIGIIGCGAVTEAFHLPALRTLNITPALLVDKNLERVQSLATMFGVRHVGDDYRRHMGKFDAAIVALPHYLHAPVCIDLLRKGVHVLVEKPMAQTVAECDRMIEAAINGRAVLAVGLMRRFLWSARYLKDIMTHDILGEVEQFDIRDGNVYAWPVTSDFTFRRATAGGGVLMDKGAHTCDSLLWWLGDFASFEYFDDSYGGVEANCEIRLKMQSGAQGLVELSRVRNLRNTAIIKGTRGRVEVSLYSNQVLLQVGEGPEFEISGVAQPADSGATGVAQPWEAMLVLQLEDWLDAIRIGRAPRISGEQGRRSIALIEGCYRQRQLLELPWMTPSAEQFAV